MGIKTLPLSNWIFNFTHTNLQKVLGKTILFVFKCLKMYSIQIRVTIFSIALLWFYKNPLFNLWEYNRGLFSKNRLKLFFESKSNAKLLISKISTYNLIQNEAYKWIVFCFILCTFSPNVSKILWYCDCEIFL